jgi:hypothetical protein
MFTGLKDRTLQCHKCQVRYGQYDTERLEYGCECGVKESIVEWRGFEGL